MSVFHNDSECYIHRSLCVLCIPFSFAHCMHACRCACGGDFFSSARDFLFMLDNTFVLKCMKQKKEKKRLLTVLYTAYAKYGIDCRIEKCMQIICTG